jgi:hypothetical protein
VTISDHAGSFHGLKITEYEPGKGLPRPESVAWKISLGFENFESETPWTELFAQFMAEQGVEKVGALVVGAWDEIATEARAGEVIQALVAAQPRLPALKALFFGDIVCEECEISWIKQTDVAPILRAYPGLLEFRVRGGDGLRVLGLQHARLEKLIVESGGLSHAFVSDVMAAELPALRHLELWLGEENYGADWSMADLAPVFEGKRFPSLEYLGLRDSDKADQIAAAIAGAPILHRLRELDLSMGTLGDAGGTALAESLGVRRLKKLTLHHHYISPVVVARLQQLRIELDVSDHQDSDDEDSRYVAVGE